MRSGFVSVIGRPNVGKSTLVNRMVGTKVSIVSSRPNTTRHSIRGVVHRPDAQIVLVDTPGLHRPRTPLGERLNSTASAALVDVDVVVVVVDATAAIGPGDRMVLGRALSSAAAAGPPAGPPEGAPAGESEGAPERAPADRERPPAMLVVVNKVDVARRNDVLVRLDSVARAVDAMAPDIPGVAALIGELEYFPVSAITGRGVDELLEAVVARLPDGPPYFPPEMVTDTPEATRVAELVREQLLSRARQELPHSIACRVTEWEWPRIRCEILVERDSQKPMVIGHGGETLKAVGSAVRQTLPPGAYLELFVRVERRWQSRSEALDRLGY